MTKEELEEQNMNIGVSAMRLEVKSVIWDKHSKDTYRLEVTLEQTQDTD